MNHIKNQKAVFIHKKNGMNGKEKDKNGKLVEENKYINKQKIYKQKVVHLIILLNNNNN